MFWFVSDSKDNTPVAIKCLQTRRWYSSNSDTSADPLPPTLLPSSAMKTPVPQSPGSSASQVETEETTKHTMGHLCPSTSNWRRYPNGKLLWLVVQPKCRSRTKNDLSELRSVQVLCDQKYFIIWHLSNSKHAGLKAFYCTQCFTLLFF